jgi:dihydrolipoamide dehydrogenase
MRDVIVIGGGSGGYAAAIRASQLGGSVTLIEAGEIGGTCVNRGCIPSKIWLQAANHLRWVRSGQVFGINATIDSINLNKIVERKSGVSGDIRMGMEGLLKNNGVEVVRGRASLRNSREIDVDGKLLETKKMILAMGSTLTLPDVPGLEEASLTTDQLLEMTEIPPSVLITGSGYIEIEMASLLNSFGCKVVLASDSSRILPREDHETSQRVSKSLREQGIELLSRLTLKSVERSKTGFNCLMGGDKEQQVEISRVAVCSRRPNTADMGLEGAGIELNNDGSICINEELETSVKGIYAIGDATGGWMLSHASSSMAVTAAENAMGGNAQFPYNLIPRALWTFPEVGAVGISEEEAEGMGIDLEIGSFPYSINGLAMCRDEMNGIVKIVSSSKFGEILGVHIVGGSATDLVGEGVLAMQLECTVSDLARSIRAHPTFSETLVDSARDAEGWALYLPKR